MKKYIEREAVLDIVTEWCPDDGGSVGKTGDLREMLDELEAIPAADVVEVVRCKDCKHRPTKPEKYDDGFDLAFPDEVCPCYCDGDPFYSRYPKDDWFCPNGERKGG